MGRGYAGDCRRGLSAAMSRMNSCLLEIRWFRYGERQTSATFRNVPPLSWRRPVATAQARRPRDSRQDTGVSLRCLATRKICVGVALGPILVG